MKTKSGFTIVELLIVIVVVAILAAITVIAYNGIQNRTNDTAIQHDLATLGKKLGLFHADNARYPVNVNELRSMQFYASKSSYQTGPGFFNLPFCRNTGATIVAISAVSRSGKKFFYTTRTNSVSEYDAALTNDGTSTAGNASCADIEPGSTRDFTAGYNPSDTTTGPWRAWTGQ